MCAARRPRLARGRTPGRRRARSRRRPCAGCTAVGSRAHPRPGSRRGRPAAARGTCRPLYMNRIAPGSRCGRDRGLSIGRRGRSGPAGLLRRQPRAAVSLVVAFLSYVRHQCAFMRPRPRRGAAASRWAMSFACQFWCARVLYLHGGVTRGKPPFYLRPAQAVWQLGLPATQGLHLVPTTPPHLQHADVRASHAKFQQRRLPRRAPSTGS